MSTTHHTTDGWALTDDERARGRLLWACEYEMRPGAALQFDIYDGGALVATYVWPSLATVADGLDALEGILLGLDDLSDVTIVADHGGDLF